MSALVDFSQLPPPNVVEPLDFESIYQERCARLLALTPEDRRDEMAAILKLESDPIVKLIQENAYRELMWRQRVNEAALAVMLPYSQREDLDNLAANFNVERLTITPANPDANPPVDATMESDDDLRERTQNAFEGMSTAGPTKGYEFHAKSADGRIADVTCSSPTPAAILITVLGVADDGDVPDEVIEHVTIALSDEDIRPVGDRVTIQKASVVTYTIDADLVVKGAGPENAQALPAAMKNAWSYANARRKLGYSIYLAKIDAALAVQGVENVIIREPAQDILRDRTQAAICTGITLNVVTEPIINEGDL